MTRKASFGLSLFVVLFTAFAANSQTIKGGICPENVQRQSFLGTSYNGLFTRDFSGFTANRMAFSAPEYSPVLLTGTSLGIGAVGTFPIKGNYIARVSVLNLAQSFAAPFGTTAANSQSILIPVELGLRLPFLNSTLGSMSYTLYGETTAGLLMGWAFPTDGSFINYSVPNSRFTTGASAYLGIGNTLRMDRYVGLYLNGGMGYFDLFSSSFMPQTRYLVPSVSLGFYFNLVQ